MQGTPTSCGTWRDLFKQGYVCGFCTLKNQYASQPRKERLHNQNHLNQRQKLPDLGNKGLKMVLLLVCPHFLREKGLANDSKCGKLFEAMCIGLLDETLCRLAWLFYELSGEGQDPKLCHKTLYKNRVCLEISLCVFWMCAFGRTCENLSMST